MEKGPGADVMARHDMAVTMIREAGELAMTYFRGRADLTVTSKGLQDVVSEADLNVELLIRRRIAEHFPEDAFLGEETGVTEIAPDQGVWVVGPDRRDAALHLWPRQLVHLCCLRAGGGTSCSGWSLPRRGTNCSSAA